MEPAVPPGPVLVIHSPSEPPASQRIVLTRRWPVLQEADGAIYRAYGPIAAARLPRVIDRRFPTAGGSARTISTHFRDDFALGLSFGYRGPRYLETVSAEGEWYCLSLRLSGDTLETVNGRDHRLGALSCYLVRYADGMTHVLRAVSDEPLAEACVMFRPAMLADRLGITRDELVARLHPRGGGADPWYSDCRMTPAMERGLEELRSRHPGDPTYRLFAEATTLELLALYMIQVAIEARGRRPAPFAEDAGALARIRMHLERSYSRDTPIDDLCRMAGLSRRGLTSAFKREYGATIGDYVREIRVGVAKTLLRDPALTVTEVAERVGYAYPANFAKVFRERVGVSPRAYRRASLLP